MPGWPAQIEKSCASYKSLQQQGNNHFKVHHFVYNCCCLYGFEKCVDESDVERCEGWKVSGHPSLSTVLLGNTTLVVWGCCNKLTLNPPNNERFI